MKRIKAFLRGATALTLFALFGLGAVAISPVALLLRRPEICQPIVRVLWRISLFLFEATGLIKVVLDGEKKISGSIIVANHPSLIDVVIIVAKFPRTLYVAKSALLRNPFLAAPVGATALPDDARLLDAAQDYLRRGWNVLIFPEGTRTPEEGRLGPLKRGAAQLALKSGSPIVALRMDVSRRILGKHQEPWDMGTGRVVYALSTRTVDVPHEETPVATRTAAMRLTETIKQALSPER